MADYVKKKKDGRIVYSPDYYRDMYGAQEDRRRSSGKFFAAAGLGAAAGGVLTNNPLLAAGGLGVAAWSGIDMAARKYRDRQTEKFLSKKEKEGKSVVYDKSRPGILKSKWEKTSSDLLGPDAYVKPNDHQRELLQAWNHIRKGKSELKRLSKKKKKQEKTAGKLRSLQLLHRTKKMPKTIKTKRPRSMTPEVQDYVTGRGPMPTWNHANSKAIETVVMRSPKGSTEQILAGKARLSGYGPANKGVKKTAGKLKSLTALKVFHPGKRMPKTISNKVRRRGMTPDVQTYLKGGKKLPTDISQKDSDALYTAFTGSPKGSTEELLSRKGIINTWGPSWGRIKANPGVKETLEKKLIITKSNPYKPKS